MKKIIRRQREQWRPVRGYEGIYIVSSFGRVARVAKRRATGDTRIRPLEVPRIVKPFVSTTKKYYPSVNLMDGAVSRNFKIHWLVTVAFLGPCPNGLEVRHLDGDYLNSRIDNLCYGTHAQNMADAAFHGTMPRGEQHKWAQGITEETVRTIKVMLREGKTPRRIRKLLDLSNICRVYDIRAGRSWKHVTV